MPTQSQVRDHHRHFVAPCILHPPSSILYPPSSIVHRPSSILHPLSSTPHPPSLYSILLRSRTTVPGTVLVPPLASSLLTRAHLSFSSSRSLPHIAGVISGPSPWAAGGERDELQFLACACHSVAYEGWKCLEFVFWCVSAHGSNGLLDWQEYAVGGTWPVGTWPVGTWPAAFTHSQDISIVATQLWLLNCGYSIVATGPWARQRARQSCCQFHGWSRHIAFPDPDGSNFTAVFLLSRSRFCIISEFIILLQKRLI